MKIVFFTIFFLNATALCAKAPPSCQRWFKSSKIIKKAKACEAECAMLSVDMGTFDCPNFCKELCKAPVAATNHITHLLGQALYYPGLNKVEKKLVAKYPVESLIVFYKKALAEYSTTKVFSEIKKNDKSDAYRHFIWAGLLTFSLGSKKAQLFLNAHEQDKNQPLSEKSMDLANNRAGILTALELLKKKKAKLIFLEKEALKQIQSKKLIILHPQKKQKEKNESI